ncbi:phage tail length tape measure family protein [Oxalobacter aliiformigenes]|uniref:phage tail length tape measure family protein n=1 Tax=Oxalobacter aliiformigenes TaxID=2946593 RepID=UPI0022AEEE10|nr:phage tail length tape measure family protein [Oxalobacter aliiformigenes]MCZ4065727.1 phage tail length tape measure family protein [Oxalobacter aliiformigenes]WAV98641.1 phage tail length tape measure family protein [Oxalobacter aliiformigenes]
MADDVKANVVIGANTEGAVAGINNLSVAMSEFARNAKKAGTDADGSFKGSERSLKSYKNQLDAINASALAGEDQLSRLQAKAIVRGVDLSPLQQQIDLVRSNLALRDQLIARQKEEAAQARRTAAEYNALQRQIDMAVARAQSGMTAPSSEYFRNIASKRNISLTQSTKDDLLQLDLLNKKVKESQTIAGNTSRAFDKYGISAAQYAAALRGVPAQITDIVVSLQGGQRPLTVLLQQGGQLKDMFGGVLPAAKALGSTLAGLVNPLTVAGTAIGVLGVAAYQGADESDRLNRALVATGGAAGLTASELSALAEQAGKISGRYGSAREAVEALASSGKMTSAEITEAMRGIDAAATVTGKSVTEIAESFVGIAEKPSEAVLKLNDGVNFLTASTYRQIVALEKQGKTQEAALVAMKAYNDEMLDRAPEMEKHLGYIEAGWKKVKDAIWLAWDALKSFGRESDRGGMIAAEEATLKSLQERYQGSDRDEQIANSKARLAALKNAEAEEKRIAAEREKRIVSENREIEKIREQIRKKTGKTDPEKSYYQSTTENIDRYIAQLKLEAQQEGVTSKAQKMLIEIESQATDSKKKLTQAHLDEIRAKLNIAKALEDEKNQLKFVADYEKKYLDDLDKSIQGYKDQIATLGMGDTAAAAYRKELEAMRDAQQSLNDAVEKGVISQEKANELLEKTKEKRKEVKEAEKEYAEASQDAWKIMTSALDEYKRKADDTGAQLKTLVNDAFQGMEDAFVKFATTGKLSFSDLIDSILADIARMYAKRATASLFDALFELGGKSIASGLGSIFGSSSSGSSGVGFKYDANQFASGLEFRASGGPVSGRSAYIVGEQGPELFVPNTGGQIIPNNRLGAGGGISIQINQKNEGTPQQVTDTSADFDGKNLIIKIVTQDIQNDGMISRTMSKTFGMRRAAGAM